MSFLQEATEEYLGGANQEDAVPVGDGAWFVLPDETAQKKEYLIESAIERFLTEADKMRLIAAMTANFLNEPSIPGCQREGAGELLAVVTEKQAFFEIVAEILEGNKENLK